MNEVEHKLKVDSQGRLVLPANLRKRLGIGSEGGAVSVRQDDSRIILEPVSEDLQQRVEEWRSMVASTRVEPFTETVQQTWKWMSIEYARRKLGLR